MNPIEKSPNKENRTLSFSLTSSGVRVDIPCLLTEYDYLDTIEKFEDAMRKYAASTIWTVVLPNVPHLPLTTASVLCHLQEHLQEQGYDLRIIRHEKSMKKVTHLNVSVSKSSKYE